MHLCVVTNGAWMSSLATTYRQFIDCDPITLKQTTPTSMPGPSHNGTALLELKRRHVAQRLNELQIRLGQIKQCQQSKDRTRGRSQGDSSFTLQGAGQQPPERDGCSPTGGLWQDGSPGHQSPGQKTITSLSESHISGPRSCSSGTRSDCLAGQNQRGVDGSGQWESHSQVTIENTGHSDVDELSRADKSIIWTWIHDFEVTFIISVLGFGPGMIRD